jgi:hypothetical protein
MASRYYILGAGQTGPTVVSQIWAGGLIVISLLVAILSGHWLVYILSSVFILIGLFSLFRPARPGLFVELQDDRLVINVLTRTKISYYDIESVSHPASNFGELRRRLENAAVAWNRFFGGGFQKFPGRGEAIMHSARLELRTRIWAVRPIPPFIVSRRSWILNLEDADNFIAELTAHLSRRVQKHSS